MKQLLSLLVISALLTSCDGKSDTAQVADSTSGTKDSVQPATTGSNGSTTSTITPATAVYSSETGMFEMGSKEMGGMSIITYFRDHGATKATYTTAELMGIKAGSVMIEKDGFVTTYDLTTKTGQRHKLPPGASAGAAGPMGAMPDFSQFLKMSAEDRQKVNFTELENRTVAGKEGKGYSIEQSGMKIRAWVWENIPLRMEMEMGGPEPMVLETTKIETDVAIPDDRFAVPADVKITEQS